MSDKGRKQKAADVLVSREPGGSIYLFLPCSGKARAWIKENVRAEGWQWFGLGLAVEHRFAADLAEGMILAGLEVR